MGKHELPTLPMAVAGGQNLNPLPPARVGRFPGIGDDVAEYVDWLLPTRSRAD